MEKTVDLTKVAGDGEVHNLAGKDRGLAAREELGLDALDEGAETVVVRVPDDVYAVSDSFLLGLLAPSIDRLGGLDPFMGKYRFEADQTTLQLIMRSLERIAAPQDRAVPPAA